MAEGLDLSGLESFGIGGGGGGASFPGWEGTGGGGFSLFGTGGTQSIAPSGFSFGGGASDLQTPSTYAPAPDTGGGGWLDSMKGGLNKTLDTVGSVAKPISQIAGLGTAGAGIANAIMGMKQGAAATAGQKQAMGTERKISEAALPAATRLTEAGASAMLGGPLPPGIQAQVDDYKRKSKAEINSYLSHAGIADSTMMAQWDAYIEQQATLYGQQLAMGLYQQGLQGLGTAGSGASALASTATQMGAGVPSSIGDANKALARLVAA